MSPLPPPPARRWLYFGLRIVLVAAIVTLLVWFNARLYFQTANYEDGDPAANSLSVLRAEHGQELYGNYSRWFFHHPGPALFYGEGLSELVLYRWLRVVQTPFTAQLLFVLLLTASFLAAGISVAARWVHSGLFVVLALSFAAIHLTEIHAARLLLINWPPYLVATTMFAFLVATASVTAGQGEDLPLLALAGSFLLHLHVAQPLFVVPMLVLAYTGLAWSCGRRRTPRRAAATLTDPSGNVPPVPALPGSALPWRAYRRAHRWALLIALLFALPLWVDLLYGSQSNLARILEHVRTHQGPHHRYLASLDYFLRFAVYQPSLPQAAEQLSTVATPHELLGFVGRHVPMLGVWLAALCSPLLALAVRIWQGQETPLLGTPAEAQSVAYASPAGRWRFLGCLLFVWAASVGLTLVWGHLQDGDLFYFNAWFDYMIWFLLALLAAGSLTDALDALLFRTERPLIWRSGLVVLCVGLAVFVVRRHPDRFVFGDNDAARLQAQHINSLLDDEPAGTPRAKLLVFPTLGWPDATAIAVALTRRDRPVDVLPAWGFMFGRNHTFGDTAAYLAKPVEANPPYEVWHVVPSGMVPVAPANRRLAVNYSLAPGGLPVDPTAGFQITCGGKEPNYAGYLVAGWTMPAEETFCRTSEKEAWIQFQPRPVPGGQDVRLTCDFRPSLFPGKLDSQRITAFFNGLNVGSLRVTGAEGESNQFVIPGEVWNKYASAFLVWELPDAVSPQKFIKSIDDRLLAFSVRSLTFAAVPAAGTPSSNPVPPPEAAPAAPPLPTPAESPAMDTPAEGSPPPAAITPAPTVEPAPPMAPAPVEPTPPADATPPPKPTPPAEPTPATGADPAVAPVQPPPGP